MSNPRSKKAEAALPVELSDEVAAMVDRSKSTRDPNEKDRIAWALLQIAESLGKIRNGVAFATWARRRAPTGASRVKLPRRLRGLLKRVEQLERLLYHGETNAPDAAGRRRWSEPAQVDALEVALLDNARRPRDPMTPEMVERVRAARSWRHVSLDAAEHEAADDGDESVLPADLDLAKMDAALAGFALSPVEKGLLVTVLARYPVEGRATSERLAERVSEHGGADVTAGAIEWRCHQLFLRIRAEATSERESGLSWFVTFQAAAAEDAIRLHARKRLALIGRHLGLNSAELCEACGWKSTTATRVREHKARKLLIQHFGLGRPGASDRASAKLHFLTTVVPSANVERVAGFSPRGLLVAKSPQLSDEERLAFLGGRWFKRPARRTEDRPMTDDPAGSGGGADDPILRTFGDWWHAEGNLAHLSPQEFRLALARAPGAGGGPISRRVAAHLERCAPCREFRDRLRAAAPAPTPRASGVWEAVRRLAERIRNRRWPLVLAGALGGAAAVALLARIDRGGGEGEPVIKGGAGGFSSIVACQVGTRRRVLSDGDGCAPGAFLSLRVALPPREKGVLSLLVCSRRPASCQLVPGPWGAASAEGAELFWPVDGPPGPRELVVLWTKGKPAESDRARVQQNVERAAGGADVKVVLAGVAHQRAILHSFEVREGIDGP